MGNELQGVLGKVDFSHQVLVAAAVGARARANGSLRLTRVQIYDSTVKPYVAIGVNNNACQLPSGESYPFVLAVIERPAHLRKLSSFDHQNFPNGCAPVATGKANDPLQGGADRD